MPSHSEFFFLFRQDQGIVDRSTWSRAALGLAAVWIVLALADFAVNGHGNVAKIGVSTLFVIATMTVAASYYFLSAKRFRDRGRPAGLALALPAAMFVCAAITFLQPANGGMFPYWITIAADIAFAGILIWNIVELGFLPGRTRDGG